MPSPGQHLKDEIPRLRPHSCLSGGPLGCGGPPLQVAGRPALMGRRVALRASSFLTAPSAQDGLGSNGTVLSSGLIRLALSETVWTAGL
jgi:hypothetical protein